MRQITIQATMEINTQVNMREGGDWRCAGWPPPSNERVATPSLAAGQPASSARSAPRTRAAGRSSRDARPRGSRHRGSRAGKAEEIVGVLGLEELRFRAADERDRAAHGLDDRDRVDAARTSPRIAGRSKAPSWFAPSSIVSRAERRAIWSRMKRLSQSWGGVRRKRASIASSECWTPRAREGAGRPRPSRFCEAKKGGSTSAAAASYRRNRATNPWRRDRRKNGPPRSASRLECAAGPARLARLAHELIEE